MGSQCPQDDTRAMWPTIQGAGKCQKRKAKQKSEDRDRVGTRTQQPGGRGHQRWWGGGWGEEQRRKADGRWRDRGGGVQSGGGQSAGPAHISAGLWLGCENSSILFQPICPGPNPYLTLVRPLRSVHLLDMSVQVIRPGKENRERLLKKDLKRWDHTWPDSPPVPAHTSGEDSLFPIPT